MQELKDELGDNLYIAQLDVRNRAAIEEMLASLPAEWSNIDILVNNAGLALGMEPAHKASVEDWETMIDTNNKGLVYDARRLPGMVERNHGHIINIGSTAGSWPYAGGNVYGATKAFVRQFSLNLRTTCMVRRCASPTSNRVWWVAPSFPMSALKAMTVKRKNLSKYRCIDARRCQRSRLVGINAACSR